MFLSCPQDFDEDFVKYFVKSTINISVVFHSSTRKITLTKKKKMSVRFCMLWYDLNLNVFASIFQGWLFTIRCECGKRRLEEGRKVHYQATCSDSIVCLSEHLLAHGMLKFLRDTHGDPYFIKSSVSLLLENPVKITSTDVILLFPWLLKE